MIEGAHLLRLMQLSSSCFPVGAFAYSQGLEGALDRGWLATEADVTAWIIGQVEHLQAHVEVPFLALFYQAWDPPDPSLLQRHVSAQLSYREARELRDEDLNLGRSTLRALKAQCVASAANFQGPMTWAGAFALGGLHFGIALEDCAHGFLYGFCENQAIAASRLLPMGQQATQRVLSQCLERVPEAVERGLSLEPHRIGFSSPGHGLSCMAHESQYSRLFLS